MNKLNDDANACRDSDGAQVTNDGDFGWMTRAGIEDCRLTAAKATLDDLVKAHDWCRANPQGNKTRDRIIRGAMRRRFKLVAGAEVKGGTP